MPTITNFSTARAQEIKAYVDSALAKTPNSKPVQPNIKTSINKLTYGKIDDTTIRHGIVIHKWHEVRWNYDETKMFDVWEDAPDGKKGDFDANWIISSPDPTNLIPPNTIVPIRLSAASVSGATTWLADAPVPLRAWFIITKLPTQVSIPVPAYYSLAQSGTQTLSCYAIGYNKTDLSKTDVVIRLLYPTDIGGEVLATRVTGAGFVQNDRWLSVNPNPSSSSSTTSSSGQSSSSSANPVDDDSKLNAIYWMQEAQYPVSPNCYMSTVSGGGEPGAPIYNVKTFGNTTLATGWNPVFQRFIGPNSGAVLTPATMGIATFTNENLSITAVNELLATQEVCDAFYEGAD